MPSESSDVETAKACPSLSAGTQETSVPIDPPVVDAEPSETLETVLLGGGCFWGVQAVFQHVIGVVSAVSGYAGGRRPNPTYQQVCTGVSGHAEVVQVTYDPNQVSFGTVLRVFFSVAHDPTQLNRQGPDSGTQYRSAIFTTSDDQLNVARVYVEQLDRSKCFRRPIVTQIEPLDVFYPAEKYHQDYATLNPDNPYIVYNDLPKVVQLKALYPGLFNADPALVGVSLKPLKGDEA